ncbi:hypothetical protein [Mesoflavibacter sp. CH_XMU1422-2]|uniref:hypothetical protein n=1 Tax=Mesoflavibacter sp. CH_XMU1422-2 TaxID=3107770 RepID=UPI0030091A37
MRIQISILILITNFAFGQKQVTIEENILKYEIKDEYNRFDNIENPKNDFESLKIEFKANSDLEIKNSYSSGFTGNDISFKINKNLEIIETKYNYWTDVLDLDNTRTYKVKNVKLTLNQNPFKKINGLCGNYILEIEHFYNDSLTKTATFKGKFKSFKGIDKTSADYLWALEQNKIFYGITNENGVYLRPDKMPSLKSDHKILTEKIKNIKGYKPDKIRAYVVINENGKIEKEPFRFFGNFGQWNDETQNKVKDLLIELTEWYPACVNEKEVKSQIPLVIGIE